MRERHGEREERDRDIMYSKLKTIEVRKILGNIKNKKVSKYHCWTIYENNINLLVIIRIVDFSQGMFDSNSNRSALRCELHSIRDKIPKNL